METVENMQGVGTFLPDDLQMASLPFEAVWRGANNAEESAVELQERVQRPNLLTII